MKYDIPFDELDLAGAEEFMQLEDLERAKRDLWFLCQICVRKPFVTDGFKLSEEFHKPMIRLMDKRTRNRLDGKYYKYECYMWPRYYYKTTIACVRVIQRFLIDPSTTFIWWHAVEEKAQQAVQWIGRQFRENNDLRALCPSMMPSKSYAKWCTASSFRFKENRAQAPSMMAYGAGSEATGGHAHIGVLDDPIGMNDIEDSRMPFKDRWYKNTVLNVIRAPAELWAQVTRWDSEDLYAKWIKSKYWDVSIRSCYETDGKPDWNGEPVLYPRGWIEQKREEMRSEASEFFFSCQMMNDPLPDTARMWHEETCEHYCSLEDAMKGPGRIFVLSDPAPMNVGSLSGISERLRGDASKDEWAIAVVRLRVRGQRKEAILLDGSASKRWSTRDGLQEACRLMMRWRTNMFFNEYYGGLGADYSDSMFDVANTSGVRVYRDRNGKLPRFADSHSSGAKNQRFEKLCDKARAGEFLISKSVPEAFLTGDNDRFGFIPQVRNWRVLVKGRNTLRFDDRADIVSRCTDSELQRFAPKEDLPPDYPWWREDKEPEFTWGTKHVRV